MESSSQPPEDISIHLGQDARLEVAPSSDHLSREGSTPEGPESWLEHALTGARRLMKAPSCLPTPCPSHSPVGHCPKDKPVQSMFLPCPSVDATGSSRLGAVLHLHLVREPQPCSLTVHRRGARSRPPHWYPTNHSPAARRCRKRKPWPCCPLCSLRPGHQSWPNTCSASNQDGPRTWNRWVGHLGPAHVQTVECVVRGICIHTQITLYYA